MFAEFLVDRHPDDGVWQPASAGPTFCYYGVPSLPPVLLPSLPASSRRSRFSPGANLRITLGWPNADIGRIYISAGEPKLI